MASDLQHRAHRRHLLLGLAQVPTPSGAKSRESQDRIVRTLQQVPAFHGERVPVRVRVTRGQGIYLPSGGAVARVAAQDLGGPGPLRAIGRWPRTCRCSPPVTVR